LAIKYPNIGRLSTPDSDAPLETEKTELGDATDSKASATTIWGLVNRKYITTEHTGAVEGYKQAHRLQKLTGIMVFSVN
jgi:hypothetical protein